MSVFTATALARIIFEEVEDAGAWELLDVYWFQYLVKGVPPLNEIEGREPFEAERLREVLEKINKRIAAVRILR